MKFEFQICECDSPVPHGRVYKDGEEIQGVASIEQLQEFLDENVPENNHADLLQQARDSGLPESIDKEEAAKKMLKDAADDPSNPLHDLLEFFSGVVGVVVVDLGSLDDEEEGGYPGFFGTDMPEA